MWYDVMLMGDSYRCFGRAFSPRRINCLGKMVAFYYNRVAQAIVVLTGK
jgi:hypothetical protein